MVNPATLSIDTALEVCSQYKPDEECGVCLEPLDAKPSQSEDTAIVHTKVCGNKHHFHRTCIMAWFCSATPNLNICPLDRTVLFGSERVPQMPLNLPTFAAFPGHDVDVHEEFYANQSNDNEVLQFQDINERLRNMLNMLEHGVAPQQEQPAEDAVLQLNYIEEGVIHMLNMLDERDYLDDDLVSFFNSDDTGSPASAPGPDRAR
jgi:hypothetical protein